ncbi:hypothetical protein G210_3260 [Candida maltosa Xu316]|uniref:Major facilitator superfamily (MFS) profile domain-containing protein n=1 Tax=Candida maltosa (strain Xu316) TaxID=1245528 RepID=M3HGU1_CANMX|nr:hypothetical protein G210_3260 [Candida maltosa Xu316]
MSISSSDESSIRTASEDEDNYTTHPNQEVRPLEVNPITKDRTNLSHLSRSKSNLSDLSKIITGIKDDQQLDHRLKYTKSGEADYILSSQLDKAASRIISRRQSGGTFDLDHPVSQVRQRRNSSRVESIPELKIESPIEETDDEDVTIKKHKPDTGLAWVMAFCAMMTMFATWGGNAAYGVFLNYYLTHDTFLEATEYDYALIGGMVVFLANFLSPISALLYKIFGFKVICFIGVVFQTAGWILASFATKIWHLYLTQGVLVGISFSLIFIPATLVLPTWFDKHLATSMGICVSGTGSGGLMFSLTVNKVIQQTGDQRWALRMVGFVCLFVVVMSAIIMKPMNYKPPPFKERISKTFIVENFKVIFDLTVFKIQGIRLIALWFAIVLIGYTLMLFSLSSYATSIGLSHSQGSVVTSVMNAAQLVGRPSIGLIADKIGRANFSAIGCLALTILLFAFWINATTYGSLIAFSALIGLLIGTGSSLAQPLAADVVDPYMERMPAAWSAINVFCSFFCLVTEVIALALVNQKSNRPYLHTQIFAGSCLAASFLIIMLLREYLIKKLLRERLEMTRNKLHKIGGATKSGYLKTAILDSEDDKELPKDDGYYVTDDEQDALQERIDRYNDLLQDTVSGYFIRTVYPVKV